jgi:F0F1-type ATP synthase membrane subunit b/b'
MDLIGALKDMFISAIPTFVLVWILYAYVAKVFYAPVRKALDERHAATAGLRKKADEHIALAERKTTEYEDALKTSRAELYKHQEEERNGAMAQRAAILQNAREKSQEKLVQARQQIQAEAAQAKVSLERQSEEMAAWIAQAVLNPTAGGRQG